MFIPTGSATFTGSLSAGRVGFDHHQMWATFVSTYRDGKLTPLMTLRYVAKQPDDSRAPAQAEVGAVWYTVLPHETRILTHLRVQACASPFFASIHGLLEGLKFEAVKVRRVEQKVTFEDGQAPW
jgi:hypothetical protein